MNKITTTPTPAAKRIMDIAGNEIENAFNGEFATIEAVEKVYGELCDDMNKRLKAIKESNLFVVSECDDICDYVRCKLSGRYSDARFRIQKKLRENYEF